MEPDTHNFERLASYIIKLQKCSDEEKTELLEIFKNRLGDDYNKAFLLLLKKIKNVTSAPATDRSETKCDLEIPSSLNITNNFDIKELSNN